MDYDSDKGKKQMLEKSSTTELLDIPLRTYQPANKNSFELYQQKSPIGDRTNDKSREPSRSEIECQESSTQACEESRQWDSDAQRTSVQSLQPRQQAAVAALLFRKGLFSKVSSHSTKA